MGNILKSFNGYTGFEWEPSSKMLREGQRIENELTPLSLSKGRERLLFDTVVISKLGLLDSAYKALIDKCASHKLTFNTHEKRDIKTYVQCREFDKLLELIEAKGVLVKGLIKPLVEDIKIRAAELECVDELRSFLTENEATRNGILESLYAAYFYYQFEEGVRLQSCPLSSPSSTTNK